MLSESEVMGEPPMSGGQGLMSRGV
jgi:hypothetical protein